MAYFVSIFVLATLVSLIGTEQCIGGESADIDRNMGASLLQKGYAKSWSAFDADADLADEVDPEISEETFTKMQGECCFLSFDMYSRNVLSEMQYEICDEGCHSGFMPFVYCGKAATLQDLRSNIVEKAQEECGCYAPIGQCAAGGLPQFCYDLYGGEFNPSWHRRRACSTTISPEVKVSTTTLASQTAQSSTSDIYARMLDQSIEKASNAGATCDDAEILEKTIELTESMGANDLRTSKAKALLNYMNAKFGPCRPFSLLSTLAPTPQMPQAAAAPALTTSFAPQANLARQSRIHAAGQQFPSDLMTCPDGAASATLCMTTAQYDHITGRISAILSSIDSICNASQCPQADWAGCVLRMAGHDFMDFRRDQGGGSDGCIDFSDELNAGLQPCIADFVELGMNRTILSTYQEVCSTISLADFFVLAAEAVMSHTRHMAGRHDDRFKEFFRYGRETATECSFSHGRLPNPDEGCSATEMVFVNHLGLNWEESAALMGVHTLGRAHKHNSGFHGWWSDPDNSRKFNNNYYVSLLSKAWGAAAVDGTSKMQYDRVDWGNKRNTASNEMMLNTDMCLAFADVKAGDAVKQSNCSCTWTMPMMDVVAAMENAEWCGESSLFSAQPAEIEESFASTETVALACCEKSPLGNQSCDSVLEPTGIAIQHVRKFAANDAGWFEAFQRAWTKATSIGFAEQPGVLLPLRAACST